MLKNAQYIYDNVIIADDVNTTKQFCKKTTGVDLSVKNFYTIASAGTVLIKGTKVAKYEEVPAVGFTTDNFQQHIGWFLPKGTYICELNEGCAFGEEDVGYIILRSSLNRNGVTLTSAVWDSSFTTKTEQGDIEGMSVRITVDTDKGIYIEKNARVGQLLVFQAAEGAEQYGTEGHQFQGRGLK